ncbi:MAG: hypothetical protein IJV60_06755 [Prevotella sp.]|nr:hypothetical protein [Prevotella sp.]MBQ8115539.1 hypothetical protein [Prevotella sp.]
MSRNRPSGETPYVLIVHGPSTGNDTRRESLEFPPLRFNAYVKDCPPTVLDLDSMLTSFDDVAYIVKSPIVILEVMLDFTSSAVNLSERFVAAKEKLLATVNKTMVSSAVIEIFFFIFVVFDAYF